MHALETSKRAEVCFDPSPGQPSPGREADHRHDHEGGDEHGVEVQAMHRHTQSNWCALRGDEAMITREGAATTLRHSGYSRHTTKEPHAFSPHAKVTVPVRKIR